MQERTNTLWILGGLAVGVVLFLGVVWTLFAQGTTAENNRVTLPIMIGDEEQQEAEQQGITLYVGPTLVDCTGVAEQQCMQVKRTPTDEYELFYDQIEGFAYEEGYEYELRVTSEPIADPPADGSAIEWTLIEVVTKTETPAVVAEEMILEDTLWRLDSYRNVTGDEMSVLLGSMATITFQNGEISGNSSCNSYFGTYQTNVARIAISVGGVTEMLCAPEELMQQEAAFLAGLASADSHRISEGQLHLIDAEGNTVLSFSELEPASLMNTTWHLTLYNTGEEAVISVLSGTDITAIFGEDGNLTGSAGCNDYTAAYELDGDTLTIGPAAATRKLCARPDGLMEQESTYLAALETAQSYAIQGNTLTLTDADGAEVATFTARD